MIEILVRNVSVSRNLLCIATVLTASLAQAEAPATPPITSLTLAPASEIVITGSQLGLAFRKWPEMSPTRKHVELIEQIQDLQFSPDGKRLLVVGGQPSEQGEWQVLNWPDLSVVASNTTHDDVIHSAVWLSNEVFVTGAADSQVIQWQLHDGTVKIVRRLDGHSRRVLAVEHCHQADLILSAGVDQSIRVWHASSNAEEPVSTAPAPIRILDNHTGTIHDLALRPGKHAIPYLASASADKTVRMWQPSIGRLVRFARLPSEPLAIAWSSDGKYLAASCVDGKLRIINPNTVKIEQTHDAITGWAHALLPIANSGFLVGGTDDAVKFIRLDIND